jgi:hypothetical protein
MHQVSHKAGLEATVERAQRELIGKLPACARARANDLRDRIDIAARLDTQDEGLCDSGCNGGGEEIIDQLDDLARPMPSNIENIFLLAHRFKDRSHLLKVFPVAARHNRERTINCTLRAAADWRI